MVKKLYLSLEFLFLFAALPMLYCFDVVRFPMIPTLAMVTGICVVIHLQRGAPMNWRFSPLPRNLGGMLAIFAGASFILLYLVWKFQPDRLFYFPANKPLVWLIVMVLYPLLSVLPQEFLYRIFFFERYGVLFPGRFQMILANAIVFSLLHVVFKNPIAPLLTFLGGILFALNYERNKSLFWVCVEHYLYGAMIFTIGLGQYFYGASFRG
jgi:membrane protease YdiL (CAAX protease family)